MSKIDGEALEWAARQSIRELSERERQEFDTWYQTSTRHQGAYLRALGLQHSLDQVSAQENLRPAQEPPAPPPENDVRYARPARRRFLVGGAMAAGLAALALLPLRSRQADRATFTTAKGEFRKMPLADRSVVSINGGSELEVEMTDQERRISLNKGEAWFEVAKDKSRPFVVSAGETRVRAVGTAFSVRRQPGGTEILVTEGVVEVWNTAGNAPRTRMTAGSLALVGEGATAITVSQDASEIERKLAWRDSKLVFRNQTLSEAAADFNRYNTRQIAIADPALNRKIVVGQYRIDQPDSFASDVRALFAVPVEVTAHSITIGTAPGHGGQKR